MCACASITWQDWCVHRLESSALAILRRTSASSAKMIDEAPTLGHNAHGPALELGQSRRAITAAAKTYSSSSLGDGPPTHPFLERGPGQRWRTIMSHEIARALDLGLTEAQICHLAANYQGLSTEPADLAALQCRFRLEVVTNFVAQLATAPPIYSYRPVAPPLSQPTVPQPPSETDIFWDTVTASEIQGFFRPGSSGHTQGQLRRFIEAQRATASTSRAPPRPPDMSRTRLSEHRA